MSFFRRFDLELSVCVGIMVGMLLGPTLGYRVWDQLEQEALRIGVVSRQSISGELVWKWGRTFNRPTNL